MQTRIKSRLEGGEKQCKKITTDTHAMEQVTDGRVGKEKNKPQETVIKTKDVQWTA